MRVISPASPWAYVQWLARDHGALLVLLMLGLPALTRRMSVPRRAFAGAVLGALLALVPLSIPVAKEPLYMAPALPFAYSLAGLALLAPDRLPPHYRRVNRIAARTSLTLAGLLVVGWIGFVFFRERSPLWGSALHAAHVCVWSVPSLRVLSRKAVAPCVVPCALTSFVLAAVLTLAGPRDLVP